MNSAKHDLEDLKAALSQHYPQSAFRTCKEAYALLSGLCAAGDPSAYYGCGWLYLKGKGVPKDTEEGFAHMLKAACCDIGNNRPLCFLAECYEKGVGVDKNPVEAYIWALMFFANEDGEDADAQTAVLERELTPAVARRAGKEAGRREKLRQEGELTPEYCLAQAARYKPRPLLQDKLTIIGRAIIPPEKAAGPTETPAEDDDPEPSSSLAYAYLKQCKRNFKPELVEFELVVPRKLTKHEDMDFTRIKIRYNKKDTDAKDISLFYPLGINKAERKLLIILAAQNSEPDPLKRADKLLRVLSQNRAATSVSKLNRMYRAIFPGCQKSKADSLIGRQAGRVAIRLTIDTTMLAKARDYDACRI